MPRNQLDHQFGLALDAIRNFPHGRAPAAVSHLLIALYLYALIADEMHPSYQLSEVGLRLRKAIIDAANNYLKGNITSTLIFCPGGDAFSVLNAATCKSFKIGYRIRTPSTPQLALLFV
jgi:hypothetical protein